MLKAEAEFPLAGSTAYLRPSGQQCRIMQRLPGNIAMITVEERFKKASSSRVPIDDLADSETEAQRPQSKQRRAA